MPEKTINDLPRELRQLYTRGFDAFQRENFDYAVELFTQILNQEPHNYEVRKVLRNAQLKKTTGGKGFFKKVFSGASSSPLAAKGQIALHRDPIEAIKIAEQILASDAHSSMGHKLLAEAAMAAEMPRTAILSLEILVADHPQDKDMNMKFGEALLAAGDRNRAERVYEQLQRQHPNDNEIFMALKNASAHKTLQEGGYDALSDGSGSYRDILRNKEEAVSLEQEKRQVKAEDVAERLIREYEARLRNEPENMKLLRELGELYTQKNDFDKALTYYGKIAEGAAGNDASLHAKIAETKARKFDHALGQLDATAPDYAEKAAQIKAEKAAYQLAEVQQRAERYPTDLQIRFELGQLYFEAGKISEATQEFQKALNNPHKRIQAMTCLAQCFARRGMNDMAARRLQEALKEKLVFDDEKKELVYTLGLIYEKMNKREEAIEQFKLIYEMDIGYKDVAAKVDAYYAGS